MAAGCVTGQAPSGQASSTTAPVESASALPVPTPRPDTPFPHPSPAATPGAGAGPGGVPLNPLEERLVEAFADLELPAGRIEVPFRGANLWVGQPDASLIVLSAVPLDSDRADFTPADARQLAGLTVTAGFFGGDDRPVDRFECDGIAYYVRGDLPAVFESADEFLTAFARAIDCIHE